MNDAIDIRDYSELEFALQLSEHTVYKKYLSELESYQVVEPTNVFLDESPDKNLCFFKLETFTTKKGEDIFQKLTTVYNSSMSLGCNLAIMVDVKRPGDPANIYIGLSTHETDDKKKNLRISRDTLQSGFISNFPGSKLKKMDFKSREENEEKNVNETEKDHELIDNIFSQEYTNIASVSCVASARDKTKTENKEFIQGIEKFIDAMNGNTYTALFIAEPINNTTLTEMRSGYENLYSTLSSFRKSIWSYNENDSHAVMESLSTGIFNAVTDGTAHTLSHTFSVGAGIGIGSSSSNSESTNYSKNDPTGASRFGSGLEAAAGIIGAGLALVSGGAAAPLVIAASGAAKVIGSMMKGSSVTSGIVNTIGKSIGVNGNLNLGYARATADTTSHSVTDTTNRTETSSETDTVGKGRTLQIEIQNKSIEEMLNRIEGHLKRVHECEDYGAYNCAAYFLSGKRNCALLAANTYCALIQGEGSSIENSAVNIWDPLTEKDKVNAIKQYLRRMSHPIFARPLYGSNDNAEYIIYTPGNVVSGLELPLHLGMPTKSVYGLPVFECAEFGRNVVTYETIKGNTEKFELGNIFHMNHEEKSSVSLVKNSLSSNTFITGSTGSGKSNTVYQILSEAIENDIHFLVIEPAKGEYKHIFGNETDVSVYGTNPYISPLLRINPFSFSKGIHILEHLDRLIEIFNVCWPMYAAMPAVLKSAVEKSYEDCGWDLCKSTNKYGENLYPTFSDVARNIRSIIDSSEYDTDNKGAYKGSLLTRLQSLSNGINGLIFTTDELSMETLFDENVIVDLSRVGSSETKSLIMGMLVLKLQEYRMVQGKMNASLNHITVMEEAHNLLKRTSTEQSSESANLLGKSVEMIANAIAEMRTYGEGFIIADQAPGLMDMSVIRNTNTKIIMRLPDRGDRELVGKAANLNDDQIDELAKLPCGVAAVYQNEWIQPVLCKVKCYKTSEKPYTFDTSGNSALIHNKDELSDSLLKCIMDNELFQKGDKQDLRELKNLILRSTLDSIVKVDLLDYLATERENGFAELRCLIYDFLKAEEAIQSATKYDDIHEWVDAVITELKPSISNFSKKQIDLTIALILHEKTIRDPSYRNIYHTFTEVYKNGGGIF